LIPLKGRKTLFHDLCFPEIDNWWLVPYSRFPIIIHAVHIGEIFEFAAEWAIEIPMQVGAEPPHVRSLFEVFF